MKNKLICLLTATLAAASFAQPPRAPHAPVKIVAAPGGLPEQPVQDRILASLDAIEANDFANFARLGNDDFKAQLEKKWFDDMVQERAARLEKGYTVVYLGDLKKDAITVHLWKLAFADKGEEWLGELSWKNGKMDGYWIH
jgi:hypothetical protein